jgi:hypothetical protein
VTNQEDLNRRLARIAKILVPIWLLGTLGYAGFYWHSNDHATAATALIVGITIPSVVVLLTTAWCILMLRQARSIPPVIITDNEIQIGSTVISQADIVRVETGARGASKRRLSLHLRDGSTRRLGIPKHVPVAAVKELLHVG